MTFDFPGRRRRPALIYILDPKGSPTCEWPVDAGLNQYGPYSSRTFTPNRPQVCIICQKSKEGQVEQFIRKLKTGITGTGVKFPPFEKGMLRKYNLGDLKTTTFTAEDASPAAYRKGIAQALAMRGPKGPQWDLGLVQIDEDFHSLYGADNPYLISKAEFLQHQIPTQEFEIETAHLSDYNLQYALNNMALAIYAKLNGTPWLIKADEGISHELVIGLGSALIGENRLGESERVVGITTIFSGDGEFHISNLSRAVAFENYKDELLRTLRIAVRQVSPGHKLGAWRPGSLDIPCIQATQRRRD